MFNITSKFELQDGTNVEPLLVSIANVVQQKPENEIKLAFIFTDGEYMDDATAKAQFAMLKSTHPNLSIVSIGMGHQSKLSLLK